MQFMVSLSPAINHFLGEIVTVGGKKIEYTQGSRNIRKSAKVVTMSLEGGAPRVS